jgi:hypothetical protein
MPRTAIRVTPLAATLAVAAIAPAAASAATPPAVTAPSVKTGLSGSLTPQSATLTGTVDPNGASTRYWFEYGTTSKLGKRTDTATVGGTDPLAATRGVTGLRSATTYHYRLAARNKKGTRRGAIRTFKTKVQPLGFSVAANPAGFGFGDATVIAGTLGGTGSTGRQVQLQANPWPYAGYQDVGNVQLTSGEGAFAFPILGQSINTRYRVRTTGKDPVLSTEIQTAVAPAVNTVASDRSVRRGKSVRFSGKLRPAKVGATIYVEREVRAGVWRRSAETATVASEDQAYTRFSARVKVNKTSRYRVRVVVADQSLGITEGTPIRIRATRR